MRGFALSRKPLAEVANALRRLRESDEESYKMLASLVDARWDQEAVGVAIELSSRIDEDIVVYALNIRDVLIEALKAPSQIPEPIEVMAKTLGLAYSERGKVYDGVVEGVITEISGDGNMLRSMKLFDGAEEIAVSGSEDPRSIVGMRLAEAALKDARIVKAIASLSKASGSVFYPRLFMSVEDFMVDSFSGIVEELNGGFL